MRRSKTGREQSSYLITAAALACYAYCPEQWRLEYGLGLEPVNRAALYAGERHHAWKAKAERLAGSLITLGRLVAALATVVLLLLLVLWWWL